MPIKPIHLFFQVSSSDSASLGSCYLFLTSLLYSSGIGQGRVTSNLQGAPIDDAVFVTDKEAVEMVREHFILSTYIHECSPFQ